MTGSSQIGGEVGSIIFSETQRLIVSWEEYSRGHYFIMLREIWRGLVGSQLIYSVYRQVLYAGDEIGTSEPPPPPTLPGQTLVMSCCTSPTWQIEISMLHQDGWDNRVQTGVAYMPYTPGEGHTKAGGG